MIPEFLKNFVTCNLTEDCFGLYCCVDLTFGVPLTNMEITATFPIWFQMDPCNFSIEAGIGDRIFREELLQYEWGKENSIAIGSGSNPPIEIM